MPESNIDPSIEFTADFAKMRDLPKAELFVKPNTCLIRQCDACEDRMKTRIENSRDETLVESARNASTLDPCLRIDRHLRGAIVRLSRTILMSVSVADQFNFIVGNQKWVATVETISYSSPHFVGRSRIELESSDGRIHKITVNLCDRGRIHKPNFSNYHFWLVVLSRQLCGWLPSSRRSIVIAPGEGHMR